MIGEDMEEHIPSLLRHTFAEARNILANAMSPSCILWAPGPDVKSLEATTGPRAKVAAIWSFVIAYGEFSFALEFALPIHGRNFSPAHLTSQRREFRRHTVL